MKTLIKINLFIISLTFALAAQSAEFAISPMMIELNTAPGTNEKFSFQIHGKKAGTAKIFLSDLKQEASGHMSFTEGVLSNTNSLASWLELEESSVKVKQGETVTINGKINIPRRTTGSHVAAIMVEEEKPTDNKGITLNVRYAIIIALNIDGKKSRISTTYEKLTIEEQNGNMFVSAWFSNNSIVDSNLESVAYIRDSNRKLMEKVILKTKSAWQRNDDQSRVFPNAKVKVYGLVKSKLPSGTFEVSARNRFAGRMQPLKRSTINHTSTSSENSTREEDTTKILPEEISLDVKKNQGFAAITVKNTFDKDITIELPESGTKDEVNFKFTPEKFTIKPNMSQMVIIRQQFLNNNIKPFEYTAKLIRNNKEELIKIKTTI